MWTKRALLMVLVVVVLITITTTDAARKNKKTKKAKEQKQFITDLESRETDPPNFVRLVLMRLIYGIAAQMGVEDRLAGFLNGAFVPPNADDDGDYGGLADLGDIGGDLGGGDLFDF